MKCVICSNVHLSYPYHCEQRAKRLNSLEDFHDYILTYNLQKEKRLDALLKPQHT